MPKTKARRAKDVLVIQRKRKRARRELRRAAAAAADPTTCYICMSKKKDEHTKLLCACKTAYAHETCVVRWIITSNKSFCAACKQPFKYDGGGLRDVREIMDRERDGCFANTMGIFFYSLIFMLVALQMSANSTFTASVNSHAKRWQPVAAHAAAPA